MRKEGRGGTGRRHDTPWFLLIPPDMKCSTKHCNREQLMLSKDGKIEAVHGRFKRAANIVPRDLIGIVVETEYN